MIETKPSEPQKPAPVALQPVVSDTSHEMLNVWKYKLPDRLTISEFWEWLMEKKGDQSTFDINIEKVLDEYHGINQRQLDKERRALLTHRREQPKS